MLSVGGINLADALLNLEHRVMDLILGRVMHFIPKDTITDADMASFRQIALAQLQQKYPEAGVQPIQGPPANPAAA